jgi:hypothetical protein
VLPAVSSIDYGGAKRRASVMLRSFSDIAEQQATVLLS